MRKIIETLIKYSLHRPENFSGGAMETLGNNTKIIVSIATVLIMQVILMFLGKWLWNNYLVKAITIVNPLESIWQIMAISVLLQLLSSS